MTVRYLRLFAVLLAVGATYLAGAQTQDCLFKGSVVPISAEGKITDFGVSRLAPFQIRIHVTELVAGSGPIEVGKDYVFPIHSVVGTVGHGSVNDVVGEEFVWWLRSSRSEDGTVSVGGLQRGEAVYETYMNQNSEEANQAADPTPRNAPRISGNQSQD
jgi:hypothetical protein